MQHCIKVIKKVVSDIVKDLPPQQCCLYIVAVMTAVRSISEHAASLLIAHYIATTVYGSVIQKVFATAVMMQIYRNCCDMQIQFVKLTRTGTAEVHCSKKVSSVAIYLSRTLIILHHTCTPTRYKVQVGLQ